MAFQPGVKNFKRNYEIWVKQQRNRIRKGTDAAGDFVLSKSKENSPVDTGRLKRSLGINVDDTDKIFKRTVASDVDYAIIAHELHTPYAEDAIKKNKGRIRNIINNEIRI